MKRKTVLISLLLSLIWSGRAQTPWTLDQCVEYAVAHNLQLRDLALDQAADREGYRQSIRDLLPSVSGNADYTIRYGRSADPNTNDYVNTDFYSNNYSIGASLDLFRGFQKLNTIRASKFIYKATREELLQQRFLLAFRVMAAYYDIRFYEGLLANSLEQLQIAQDNYDLVDKKVELGLLAGADRYEARSNLLGDQLLVTQNRNLLATAKLSLIQEMNLEGQDDIVLQPALNPIVPPSAGPRLDSLYQRARSFVPLVKSQEYRVDAAKKQLQASRGSLYPSLALVAGYGTGYFETNVDENGKLIPFKTQFNDNSSKFVGIQLSIPISEGWAAHSRVKQRKIAYLKEQNALEIQEQELFKLLQQLLQDQKALIAEYGQSDQKVMAQELAFSIAQKRYEKGMINALELFQAKNLYGTAQNENLQVGLRLQINQKTLDFYRGLPVFNINP